MFEATKQGAVYVVGGDEPFDHEHAAEIRQLLETACRTGQPLLVVDLHQIALMDSAAVECLLDCGEQAEARGGALKLAAPNALCCDILRVSGLTDRFEIHPNARSAVRSFTR